MLLFKKLILLALLILSVSIKAQTSPLKSFSLKVEPIEISSDTNGTTYRYSAALIVSDSININQIVFKLKNLSNDSLVNSQTFIIPQQDGIYQTDYAPNGLIKDGNAIYILLGNIKSKHTLYLQADLTDHLNTIYTEVPTNN